MDFSEKDAARSKWRLTQRHRRGRGGGRGVARASRAPKAAVDLGSNDRYFDDEAEPEQATAATAGPALRSQGANLADLLQQADAFDTHFYFRSRANLAEEFGLPPQTEAAAYQGLSLDLQGLAACLALLPRNAVLSTDAFSEDSEGEEEGEGAAAAAAAAEGGWHGAAAAPQQDSGPAGKQQQQQQHGQQRRPSGQPPRQWETTAAAQKQAVPPAAPAAPAAAMAGSPPSATGAAVPAQPDSDEADELLTELLGPEPAPPAGLANSSSQVPAAALASGRSAAPPPRQKQPASVPSKLYHPVQQRPAPTQQPAAPVAGRGAVPVAQSQAQHPSGHDSELDFLLGLPSSSGSSKQGGTGPPGGQRQQQEQGSLEDWLDAL